MTRLHRWLLRRDAARSAEIERNAAMSDTPSRQPESCQAEGETVCFDEAELLTPQRDGGELEGSLLEVGGAIAGLTPVESPEVSERRRQEDEGSSASECDTCR